MTWRQKIWMAVALGFLAGFLGGDAWGQAAPPGEIVAAVQKRYEATKSLRAKFTQQSFLKIMGQSQKAQGDVWIKKPGKMKWVYTAPDPQVLITHQGTLWLYLPEDGQATKMKIDNVYSSNTPALFLAGRGSLTESFNVGQVLTRETSYKITLFPKNPEGSMDRLVVWADKKSYQIIGSSVYDKLGNRTDMRFREIQVNPDLPDSIFRFIPPEGVEIIDVSENSN
ncbi:MAG: outer membrane lipoprotein chaperone LolA [Nitrospinaceae bacterium]